MRTFSALIALLLLHTFAVAQSNDEFRSVQLQAEISDTPLAITLTWDDQVEAASDILVFRRLAGTNFWGSAIASLSPGTLTYQDTDVEEGQAYEYRVTRPSSGNTGNGYLYSSTALAAPVKRGVLILVIDDALLPALEVEIERYRQDVLADGWLVKSLLVSATEVDTTVKNSIRTIYEQAPDERHALFLLGHVPVPYSGNIAPDGHTDHRGAWSADVYYADMDGTWTDAFVNDVSASNPRNRNIPGDGKWDASSIPSDLELETGRVDFHNLPRFSEDAITLTRRYLDKNHAFRRKQFSVPARGLIENNFGGFAEGFGQNGLKNFATLVGRDSTRYLDYDVLKTDSYLFSYGCGAGNYQGASGIANTQAMTADSFQSVFTFLFGSYFGDWDIQNNFLRAALGSGTILTNAWAGRPNWALHPMGLGETIGYCAKLTQNNASFSYDPGFGNRSIHVTLLGDPTLRMHIIAPPTDFVLGENQAGIQLSWIAPVEEDLLGYHIYRRNFVANFYERLNEEVVTELFYTDPCPLLGDSLQYLVKAVRLETTPSGRFYNESSGVNGEIAVGIDRSVTADFVASIDGGEVEFTNESINATNYEWDFGDGATSTEASPTHLFTDGMYQVQLIAQNSCSVDSFTVQVVIMTVGTVELAELGLRILPNPVTSGRLQIVSNRQQENVKALLIDALGRVRLQQSFAVLRQESMDVSTLETGLYVLQLEIDGQQVQQQIVIQHP
ncbi:MAG: PKD domain-containing protein [Bacteroidota bacterium]